MLTRTDMYCFRLPFTRPPMYIYIFFSFCFIFYSTLWFLFFISFVFTSLSILFIESFFLHIIVVCSVFLLFAIRNERYFFSFDFNQKHWRHYENKENLILKLNWTKSENKKLSEATPKHTKFNFDESASEAKFDEVSVQTKTKSIYRKKVPF